MTNLTDWSEPLSTLPARVVKLTEALNQKKYLDAQVLATDISLNMSEVTLWIGRELKGENDAEHIVRTDDTADH